MNKKQSKKNVGIDFHLHPPPESRTWTFKPVAIADELNRWRFEAINQKQHTVRFSHALGYFRDIPFSFLVGHEQDGRYKLKCKLIINGPRVDIIPISLHGAQ